MVGRLARWLRVLGFDVVYSNKYADDEIIRIAEADGRVILTRDAGLAARRSRAPLLLIQSGSHLEQVREIVRAFHLQMFEFFSRCLECNAPLLDVDKESVFERVPPYVYLTHDRFALCPSCGRVYWRGTHVEEMIHRIQSTLRA